MDKIKFPHFIVAIMLLSLLTGCTLPGFSTPTPFSFPTPDKTMTALFEPTQAAPATSAPSDSTPSDSSDGNGQDGDGVQNTDTPKAPTDTPEPTATKTPEITDTIDPDDELAGPAVRSGPSITADWMENGPGIDGDLSGWAPPIQKVITYVVWGADKWSSTADSSGTVVAGWNETYLFLGVRVKDDKYVQEASEEQLYLGDSIEILFDRYVAADYYLHSMSADDYQIGISPGKGGIALSIKGPKVAAIPDFTYSATTSSASPPEAYVWFPKTEAGTTTAIKIGSLEGSEGYQVEMRIPWSLLGVTNPQEGDHYGFAVSISDNDSAGTKKQQSMTSNVSTRIFSDPTTWGDLYLKK